MLSLNKSELFDGFQSIDPLGDVDEMSLDSKVRLASKSASYECEL
jgi:hypothetical protein